jgi:Replication protein C C-terminal region
MTDFDLSGCPPTLLASQPEFAVCPPMLQKWAVRQFWPLWRLHSLAETCVAMGRECAAVAVALVSAKPAEHFRTSLGGYFHGMVAKAKAGELNLVRTLWGLRQAKAAKERGSRLLH